MPSPGIPQHRGGPSRTTSLGGLAGRDVWIVQGRVHLYEGYTPEEVTRYVRLLHALGVRTLILTNAAGSVDGSVGPGEIVLAADAINLFFRALAAPAEPASSSSDASPEALSPWRRREPLVDRALLSLGERVASEERISIRTGVLVGSLGPSYETAAEVRRLAGARGTVASMSTVRKQSRRASWECAACSSLW